MTAFSEIMLRNESCRHVGEIYLEDQFLMNLQDLKQSLYYLAIALRTYMIKLLKMNLLMILLALLPWTSWTLPRNLQLVKPPPLTSASLTKISVIKSQLDPLNYTSFKLPNDLNFMVVIDPTIQADMLYAWSIHTGELESPTQYPGMEYVLASAIMYGSNNYVAIDSYENFIAPAYMQGKRDLRLDAMTIVQGGPSSMGSEIVSRVTDILVNPQLSTIAVGRGIQDAIKAANYYENRFDLSLVYLQLFCTKEYSRVFVPQIVSSLRSHTEGDYAAQVRKYFNTYVSSDVASAAIMLAEWNQTLIDDAINQLAQMINRKALPKLYNQSVTKDFTPTTPLYYLLNSPRPSELYIRIIPTNGMNEKYAYEEIWLLAELMDTADGLVDTLKFKYPQIDKFNKFVREANQNNYPSIEIRVFFKQGQPLGNIPQQIYAYIFGYMTQNWGKVYNSQANKIIDSLNYKFLISPFASSDQLEKMKNIVFYMGFDTPANALNSLFAVDKSKILPQDEKAPHEFKVVGLELGSFTGEGDGTDSVFRLKYKAVKVAEPIPAVPPPVFTPNPYAYAPTAQFTGYASQDWPSFQKGSAIFYPNPHTAQPYASVSCVLHFKPPSPLFGQLFLTMVWQRLQKEVRLVREVQLLPQWNLNLVTIEQTGAVVPIFRFLGLFFDGVFASFNEGLFNDIKSTLTAQFKAYNSGTTIEEITFFDQSLLENPSQLSIQSLTPLLNSYDFNTFLVEIAQFTNSLKLQWLILGFKETNDDIQKNIDALVKKQSLSPYSAPSAPSFTPYTKTFSRSGSNSSSALYFIDFGKKSVNTLVMTYFYKQVINYGIGSQTNPSNFNIINLPHLTSSGRIGLNIVASSPTANSATLQSFLDALLQSVESKDQTAFLQNNFNTIRQNTQKALTFTPFPKSVLATVSVLSDYLSAGCYECLLAWPSQLASTISAVTFPQLQAAWKAAVAAKSTILEQP